MSNSNGIITKPINVIGDIAYVLGSTSGDVGTLCKHPSINPASKIKPFIHSVPHATLAQRKTANCGWVMQSYTTLSALFTAGIALSEWDSTSRDTGLCWNYDKPRGVGQSYTEWFDVLDFDGYEQNANWPFKHKIIPSPMYTSDSISLYGGDDSLTKEYINGDGSASKNTFSPNTFKYMNLNNLKCGIALREANNSSAQILACSGNSFSDINLATLKNITTQNKTYDVVIFFTDQTIAWDTVSFPTGIYVLAPCPHSTWQRSTGIGVYVDAELNPSRNAMTGDIYSLGRNRPYYKIELSSTSDFSSDVKQVGTSGTLYPSPTGLSFNWLKAGGWPSSIQIFYIRFWVDASTSYIGTFVPRESPMV